MKKSSYRYTATADDGQRTVVTAANKFEAAKITHQLTGWPAFMLERGRGGPQSTWSFVS